MFMAVFFFGIVARSSQRHLSAFFKHGAFKFGWQISLSTIIFLWEAPFFIYAKIVALKSSSIVRFKIGVASDNVMRLFVWNNA